MKFPIFRAFTILVFVGITRAVDFPLPTCGLNSPKYEGCLKKAVETSVQKLVKGIPGFNFPDFEHFKLGNYEVQTHVPGVSGTLTFNNAVLDGATKIRIDSAKLNGGNTIVLEGGFKELTLSSDDIQMKGKLMVTPVEVKHANFKLEIKDVGVHVEIRFNAQTQKLKKAAKNLVNSVEIHTTLKKYGDLKFTISATGSDKTKGEKLNSMLGYSLIKSTVFRAYKKQIEQWIGEKLTDTFRPFLTRFKFGELFPKE